MGLSNLNAENKQSLNDMQSNTLELTFCRGLLNTTHPLFVFNGTCQTCRLFTAMEAIIMISDF